MTLIGILLKLFKIEIILEIIHHIEKCGKAYSSK